MKKQKKLCTALKAIGLAAMAVLLLFTGCNTDELKTSTSTLGDNTECGPDEYWDDESQSCEFHDDGNYDDCGPDEYWDDASQSCEPHDDGNYDDKDDWNEPYDDKPYDDEPYDDEPYYDDGGGDGGWGWVDNGGHGQGTDDCFGVGNEECRDQALKGDFRDMERMQREIKQLMKKDKENTEQFESMLTQLDELEERLEDAGSQEEVDSIREEIWTVQRELERFRMQAEIERMKKERERQAKHFEKDKEFLTEMMETVSDEWKEKIQEQLDRLERLPEIQNQMIEAMEAGEDWDVIDELRWELDDIYWEMDDFWWEFEEIKIAQWAGQMFDQVEKDIDFFLEHEYQYLSDDMKEKADEIVGIAKALIEEGRKAQEEGDMMLVEDIQFRLEELGMKAENLFGKPKPKFDQLGFTEDFDMSFEDFSGDMSYEKQVEIVRKILTANPDIIQQVLLSDPVLAEMTLKIFDKVPDNMQNGYLEGKADLGEVYEEILDDNSQIASYKEEILGYNYFGDPLDELVTSLEEVRDGTMTLGEVMPELAQLQQKSKELKHSVGIISFPDYDDGDWYYESVEGMTDFLKGKEKEGKYEFAGGDNITFAETLKITLEKFGKEKLGGTTSYGPAQNHWAQGYYVTAEQMGITLMDPDHLITRGEMARLIVEVTLGSPKIYTASSFSDLSASDPYFNYLETLHDYGIISGDSTASGLPTVRSGDNINRAETAKVINTASEKLQFETLEIEDLDYLLEDLGEMEEIVESVS